MPHEKLEKYAEGTRVRLRHDVDRYPHFIARGGSLGTVAHNDGEVMGVRLDDALPGAEEWNNEVIWSPGNDGIDPDLDLEVVPAEAATATPTKFEQFSTHLEAAWWKEMQGELLLDENLDLAALAMHMESQARETVKMLEGATEQRDAEGNEIAEVSDEEYARRVARALAVLFYGGS